MTRFYKAAPYIALLVILLILPLILQNQYYLGTVIIILINVLLASSLWFIITTGQVSLGHAGFAAIGAYISAALVTSYGQSSWLALVAGVVVAAIVAALLGYLTLRIKGIYFIMVTLASAEVFRLVFSMIDTPFGGLVGLMDLPPPTPIAIPGLFTIDFTSKASIYYLILVFVLLCLVIMHRLNRSRIGLIYFSIMQADKLSEHVGINIVRYKVQAFVIGSMVAGVAGVLYSYVTGSILPTSFTLNQSIYYLVYNAIGGGASIAGPILGTAVLNMLSIFLRPIKEFEPIIYGLMLIGVILFLEGGLLGVVQRSWARFRGSSFGSKFKLAKESDIKERH